MIFHCFFQHRILETLKRSQEDTGSKQNALILQAMDCQGAFMLGSSACYKFDKFNWKEVVARWVCLFSQVAGIRMTGNGLKLCQGRFRLDYSSTGLSNIGTSCPGKWLSPSPLLDVFKGHVVVELRDMV